jgi:hypothetical protein
MAPSVHVLVQLTGCRLIDRLYTAIRCAAPLSPDHVPDLHGAHAFHLDEAYRCAIECIPNQLVGIAGDLDASHAPVRFHAARQVHCLTPKVVDELLAADDASNDRTGVDADAE